MANRVPDSIALNEENKEADDVSERQIFSEREQGVSFTTKRLHDNKAFGRLRDSDPTMHKMISG